MPVSDTSPRIPAFPDICFGSAADSLGPSGRDIVPAPAASLFNEAGPAGASPRPGVIDSAVGQSSQQGDENWYQNCIFDAPTTPGQYPSPPSFELGKSFSKAPAVQDFQTSPGFNDVNTAGMGSIPPTNAPGVAEAIAFGAERIGGGVGGHFGESSDQTLTASGTVSVPPARDTFNPAQASESPGAGPATSLRSDLAGSTIGPGPRVNPSISPNPTS